MSNSEYCSDAEASVFSLDQICGVPTGEGGEIPQYHIGQVCGLILGIADELGKNNGKFRRVRPLSPAQKELREVMKLQQNSMNRLVALLPEGFLGT